MWNVCCGCSSLSLLCSDCEGGEWEGVEEGGMQCVGCGGVEVCNRTDVWYTENVLRLLWTRDTKELLLKNGR